MGNSESLFRSQLSRSRIEIVMADTDGEENNINNDFQSLVCKNKMVLSHNSLSSIMSITSSTQTDPELFTQWPKKRFMFQWLNKLKNYHSLLSKSQQLLTSTMFLNLKSDEIGKNSDVKSISLSTQTINKLPDNWQFSNHLKAKETEKQQLITSLKYEGSQKLSINDEKHTQNPLAKINNNETIVQNQSENDSEGFESAPLLKKQKLHNYQSRKANGILISQLSNNFYKSEISKSANSNNSLMESVDSLTSVTLLSKLENKSLIYQSRTNSSCWETNSKQNKRKKSNYGYSYYEKDVFNESKSSIHGKSYQSKTVNMMRKRRMSQRNVKKISKGSTNLMSSVGSPVINSLNYLTDIEKNDKTDDSNKYHILSYKFWVTASGKNWNIFHNPTDRRIESIGRIAKCRIQLTHCITRHSDGLLKQQVIIYAPNQDNLEKCCKLFDDKFPDFYATSGLLKILYFRKDSKFVGLWNNCRDCFQINPLTVHKSNKHLKRKRNSISKRKHVSELGFLRNQVVKD